MSAARILALALAGAALALGSAAHAETVQRTRGVSHADLDLATPEGNAELDRRIEHAAREVCGVGETTVGSRIRSREARACYDQARQQLDQHFAGIRREAQRG